MVSLADYSLINWAKLRLQIDKIKGYTVRCFNIALISINVHPAKALNFLKFHNNFIT